MKKIELEDIDTNVPFISNINIDHLNDGKFVKIEIKGNESSLIIGQVAACETDGKMKNVILIKYDNNVNFYPVFYYATTKLMYHSIMYLRHLPIKSFNRLCDEGRFLHEMKNINLLLSILKESANFQKILDEYWVNPENSNIIPLIELAKEYWQENWEITDTRLELFSILENRIEKIVYLYNKKKYNKIRDIGYEIHNLPQMLCENKIYEYNFS